MSNSEQESKERRTLGPNDAGRAISAEEFAAAEQVPGLRFERLEGRLVVVEPGGLDHEETVRRWRERLDAYKTEHPDIVARVKVPAAIPVNDATDRVADIGVYLAREGAPDRNAHRVPDLVFEVVQPTRRDRQREGVELKRLCHQIGVKEYVLIDRPARQVTLSTTSSEGYRERIVTLLFDTYESRLLPGLAIPLVEVMEP